MSNTLHQARENLLQAAVCPTWYDHLPKVEAAMAAQKRIADIRRAAGWDGDDGGWYGPHPVTGDAIREADWEEVTGLPLPEDAATCLSHHVDAMEAVADQQLPAIAGSSALALDNLLARLSRLQHTIQAAARQ